MRSATFVVLLAGPCLLFAASSVNPAQLTISTSANTLAFGEPVTLTANVPAISAAPHTISFYDGRSILGTVPYHAGSVSLTIPRLAPGRHSLHATLSGGVGDIPKTSPSLTLTVNPVAANAFAESPAPAVDAIADLNGDGIPDLVGIRAIYQIDTTAWLTVALGKGDGTFQLSKVSAVGILPGPPAIADFNGDGHPDMAFATDNTVSILIGVGDGSFRPPVTYPAITSPSFVYAVDLNGDGRLDLIVGGRYIVGSQTSLSILLGKGDGTFLPPVNIDGGNAPWSLGLADFNHDGKIDLVTTNALNTAATVLMGNGTTTFQTGAAISSPFMPLRIVTADFNRDGNPDFAFFGVYFGGTTIVLGNGDGTFRTPVEYQIAGNSLSVADVNGDGIPDLIVGAGDPQHEYVWLPRGLVIMLGNGDGSFQAPIRYLDGTICYGVTSGDLNGDGRTDLVVDTVNGPILLLGASATRLKFTSPLSGAIAQMPVNLVVQPQDAAGNKLDIPGSVTLSSLPAGISATATVTKGAATFTGLVFPTPGNYTLTATAAGLPSTSAVFTVSMPKLVFSPPPVNSLAGMTMSPVVVSAVGNISPNAPVTLTSTPPGLDVTVAAVNGVAVFSNLVLRTPGNYTLTASTSDASAVVSGGFVVLSRLPATRMAVVRNGVFNFDTNGNGVGPAPNDPADRTSAFAPPGGILAGDIPVAGDWNGDGRSKPGWFRPTGGQWWLDANNDGVYTAGVDFNYKSFGGPGDVPVIGDWTGLGKSAIGIVSGGFLWVLDLNADGIFQAPVCTPVAFPGKTPDYPACTGDTIMGDAVFAFGGPGDSPVVGNWSARTSASGHPISQAGVVRPYKFDDGTYGGPFLWLLDGAVPGTPSNVTPIASHYMANLPGIAFGGAPGDIPITGDWYGTGFVQFGMFRQGFLWLLDNALPGVPQSSHGPGVVFAYGGAPGDRPLTGAW